MDADNPGIAQTALPQADACLSAVRQLCARYQWGLLSADSLYEQVLADAPTSLAMCEQLARHHYARALFAACDPAADPDRRELAYTELLRYLHCAAYNRRPDLADDVAQRALLLVVEQLPRCREPGAFFTFALFKLRHAIQQEESARGERLAGREIDFDLAADLAAPEPPDAFDLAGELAAALGRLVDVRQRQVVALKFLGDLSDEAIGARLQLQAAHVRVLRHRGLSRLRADPQLCRWLDDGGTVSYTRRTALSSNACDQTL